MNSTVRKPVMTTAEMIGKIASSRGVLLQEDDPAFMLVDLNMMALQPFLDKLQELEDLPDLSSELSKIRAQLSSISPSKNSDPSSSVVGATDMLRTVQQQWSDDARSIGDQINSAQGKLSDILQEIHLLEQKNLAYPSVKSTAPVQIKTVIEKPSPLVIVWFVLGSILLTSCLFIGGYFLSPISKSAELGVGITRIWPKLDLPTRTKVTDLLKDRS